MSERIYASEDECLTVSAVDGGALGPLIQIEVHSHPRGLYGLTPAEAKDLCIRLAAYLGEQER